MVGKVIIGSSFGNWCHYAINEEKSAQVLVAMGVRPWSAEEMAADFDAQRDLRPGLGQATMHVALAWPNVEKDQLTDDLMAELATEYLKRYLRELNEQQESDLKFEDTQWAFVRHHDRNHPHGHLMVNRVTNQGEVISDSKNFQLSARVCRELEEEYGLLDAARTGREDQLKDLADPAKREKLTDFEVALVYVNEAVHRRVTQVTTVPALTQALADEPVPIRVHDTYEEGKLQAIVFERDGQFIKGSLLTPPLGGEQLAQLLTQQQEKAAAVAQVEAALAASTAAEAAAEARAAKRAELQQRATDVLAEQLQPRADAPLLDEQDYWARVRAQGYRAMQVEGQGTWQLRHEASGECFSSREVSPGGPAAPSITVQLDRRLQAQGLVEITAKMEVLLDQQNFTTFEECQALVRQAGYQTKRDNSGDYLLHEATQRRFTAAEVQPNGRNLEEQVLEIIRRRQAELVHGSISIPADAKRSAAERGEVIRQALLEAGAKIGVTQKTMSDLGEPVIRLEYSHLTNGPQLDAVNEVLHQVQNAKQIKVREQSTAYGQPMQEWPPRSGQYGQATVVVTASSTLDVAARAARISAALQEAGARVLEAPGKRPGELQLEVRYHTQRNDLASITATLDSVQRSTGLEVKETNLAQIVRGGQLPEASNQQEMD